MDSSDIRGYIQRFEDQGYKTWIKTTMILECLKTRMGKFLENETDIFHNALNGKIKLKEKTCIGQTKCDYKKVPTGKSAPNKLCPLCDAWKEEILSQHKSPNPRMLYWNNTTPYLWPSHKWEVAKVYMPRGNMMHKSVDDFDISAFLTLMSFCRHFENFVKGNLLSQVTNVRNQIMHSASFAVSSEDFQEYMRRIKALGEALGENVPEFQSFSKDMAEVQNIDFQLKFGRDVVHQSAQGAFEDKYDVKSILNMELKIMKDKMEYLSQLYDADRENMLTSEELQKVKNFLDMNHDLQEKLQPQWQRLEAVQAQHGLQINTLTERVGELEKHTVITDEEFSSETLMYKNHLLERAKKYKWADPVFSEQDESAGFRGRVEVHGETFLGPLVCKSKAQAHQAVAKKALQELATVIANEEAALVQAAQSQTVLQAGPSFFAAVTVSLAVDVSPDKGGSAAADRVEYVYEKLVSLFGLGAADTGSSNKEKVLQYCSRLNVPPPMERSSASSFVLRLNGQITFYDVEGSRAKAVAEQQAAKVALEGLCGVLDKAAVSKNNHKGALQELLMKFKQPVPGYLVTDSPGGHGDRVTWLPGEDPTGSLAEGRPDDGHRYEEVEGAEEGAHAEIGTPMKRMIMDRCDRPSKMSKVLLSTAGSERPDEGQFFGCVQVTIQVDLRPHQAADQEGAVGAAYSDLMKALSLSPASSGEEKQAVLEFFRQTQCCPPVEKIDQRPDGTYSCSLRIDGKLTFQSPERSTKKESDSLAAQKALAHLEGLQTVKDLKLTEIQGGVKGRLQKVAADLGNIGVPVYRTADAGKVTDGGQVLGTVQVTIQVDLRPHQAADQERAVGAAYSDLMKALSLSPASSGEEKQAVLEFFRQTQCCPPVEKIEPRPDGTYSCSLRIDGKLTFQSPERTSIKKESDSLAAQKALAHLEGLQTVKYLKLPGEVKGRLQKVAANLGNICYPVYCTADAGKVTDGGPVLGFVEVTIQVDLRPHQAADQEGAVGAAYSDLMKALSLSPASSGEEKQAVLEFFRQTQCCPPVEKIDPRPDGTYSCSLRIDGKLTFQSPEQSTKKESDSLAAQKALAHLEGLQTVKDLKLPGEVKGRLQKVAADLGNICNPVYDTADAGKATDGGPVLGFVEVTIQVDLRPHQAADQEGAVGAAYSDLMEALSLSPASSGEEKQAVLEFFRQTQCCPPVEKIDPRPDGTYSCSLRIDGKLTFQSPERSSTKKEAEKLAAGQALGHLEGLLRANCRPLPVGDNYKNRLQELLMAGLGNAVVPTYSAVDANDPCHTLPT